MVDKSKVSLGIWDCASQDHLRPIIIAPYRIAHVVMIVFDVGNRETFKSIDKWLKEIDENCPKTVCKCVIGNKRDIAKEEREVSCEDARRYCSERDLTYFETSARADYGVEEAFEGMAREQLILSEIRAMEALIEAREQSTASKLGLDKCSCVIL